MHVLLAASWLDPIVNFLAAVVMAIDKPIGNLGWSLIILAALIRLVFWPLNTAQFKAFLKMQKIAPLLKTRAGTLQRRSSEAAARDDGAL